MSRYLELVRSGETLEILSRKRPVARVIGIEAGSESATRVERLVEMGVVRPPDRKRLSKAILQLTEVPKAKTKEAGVLKALLRERREGR